MANVTYRRLEGSGEYGIFDRNYMLGKTTEHELRYTLALCENDLNSGLGVGEYGKALERLRASILDALGVA